MKLIDKMLLKFGLVRNKLVVEIPYTTSWQKTKNLYALAMQISRERVADYKQMKKRGKILIRKNKKK